MINASILLTSFLSIFNIVKVYQIIDTELYIYIVMEYVRGGE